MNTYIGIDLGTSGVKLILVSSDGEILSQVTKNYNVIYPNPGWTEQAPSDWVEAVDFGMKELLEAQDKAAVRGISFGGQMHGLVVLDKKDNVIRPCILWNDGRTEKETVYLNNIVGEHALKDMTGNIAFAGFTAPKLLWMREKEPKNFARIAKIMLPKDYLAYNLSGNFASEYSDAAGTLLLDVKKRKWSKHMCDICEITEEQLPKLYESYDVIGNLKPELADKWGLSKDVKIIIGAGDNAAAAVGCGAVKNGSCNISLGTSGTVFISSNKYSVGGAIHSFCHANGKFHLLGCILSAASCRKWWLEEILGSKDYNSDDSDAFSASSDGLYFLPYLSGERSPHNDVNIRGAFLGLSADTTKAQMSRAVMEGVSFAIRDCIESARAQGIKVERATLCGGGAKGNVWRQMLSDILGIPLDIPKTEQGPSYGGAMLAMVGCGEYESVAIAAEAIVQVTETVQPRKDFSKKYKKRYEVFKQLYPALKGIKLI